MSQNQNWISVRFSSVFSVGFFSSIELGLCPSEEQKQAPRFHGEIGRKSVLQTRMRSMIEACGVMSHCQCHSLTQSYSVISNQRAIGLSVCTGWSCWSDTWVGATLILSHPTVRLALLGQMGVWLNWLDSWTKRRNIYIKVNQTMCPTTSLTLYCGWIRNFMSNKI